MIFAIGLGTFALPGFLAADVTFNVTYEAGSQWELHPQSAAAKANLEQLLSDLGVLFIQEATIEVSVNDDETEDFASAGADAHDYITLLNKDGEYFASGVWIKIVKGMDVNGGEPDCTINWNWDINGLYGGDVNAFLDRIRGLARHEIMHPLGMGSTLTHDRRGSLSTAFPPPRYTMLISWTPTGLRFLVPTTKPANGFKLTTTPSIRRKLSTAAGSGFKQEE